MHQRTSYLLKEKLPHHTYISRETRQFSAIFKTAAVESRKVIERRERGKKQLIKNAFAMHLGTEGRTGWLWATHTCDTDTSDRTRNCTEETILLGVPGQKTSLTKSSAIDFCELQVSQHIWNKVCDSQLQT